MWSYCLSSTRLICAVAMVCGLAVDVAIAGFPDSVDLAAVSRQYGQGASSRIRSVQNLVARHSRSPVDVQLEVVNEFFNAIPWRTDQDHWRSSDYWATPLETLASNGADCEDFAIAKYFTLIRMGVSAKRLRFVFARLRSSRERHVVLAYFPTGNRSPLILDNVQRRIRPAHDRADLSPLLSFNTSGAWRGVSGAAIPKGKGARGIPAWRQMVGRMR